MHIPKLAWAIVVIVAFLACADCAEAAPPPTASIDSDDVSYFVLGVNSANLKLQIEKVDLVKAGAVTFSYHFPHFYGPSDSGYVIGKVKGRESLGIQRASMVLGKSIFGAEYTESGNAVIFRTIPGKIVYVGDVEFDRSGTGLVPKNSSNIGKARAFLKANYPKLEDKLVQGELSRSPVWP